MWLWFSFVHRLTHWFASPGALRAAEAVPGLVSEAVPVHSGEPVAALRFDPIHLRGRPSLQRGAELRYPASLGHHWLASHHLHGKRVWPQALGGVKESVI